MKYPILLATVLLSSTAIAQNGATPSPAPPASAPRAGQGAMMICRADLELLCAGMHPGDGKLGQCVRTNYAKLSSGCREALQSMRGQRQSR